MKKGDFAYAVYVRQTFSNAFVSDFVVERIDNIYRCQDKAESKANRVFQWESRNFRKVGNFTESIDRGNLKFDRVSPQGEKYTLEVKVIASNYA